MRRRGSSAGTTKGAGRATPRSPGMTKPRVLRETRGSRYGRWLGSGGHRTRLSGRLHVSGPEDSRLPRGAEHRGEVSVDAVVAGDLPGEDQPDGEGEHDRVRGRGAREQEGHVHGGSEEGRDAGKEPDDEPDP